MILDKNESISIKGNFYENSKNLSFLENLLNVYNQALQDFRLYLYKKGWILSSNVIPSLFGEPLETFRCLFRRFKGWQPLWEKHGFYNAADPHSLKKLQESLRNNDPHIHETPVLLFHGLYSSPDIWIPWAAELNEAKKNKKIGHVITLQLPNDFTERMKVVYQAIDDITTIYSDHKKEVQVDIIGHSSGGYAGHLAAFHSDHIEITDDNNVERRWHSHNPAHRNKKVRKVISVAAPTWLCCRGQHDETTPCNSSPEFIYPWKVFSERDVEKAYTETQIKTIQNHHDNIYDIVATQDALSSNISPLHKSQVFNFKLGHLGVVACKHVCKKVISILSGEIHHKI